MNKKLCVWAIATVVVLTLCGLEIALGQETEMALDVELIPKVAFANYSEQDPDLMTLNTLVPMLKDISKTIPFNSKNMTSEMTTEGLGFYNRLMAIQIEYKGKQFQAIQGVGFVNGSTMAIRKRGFFIFTWPKLEPLITKALIESGFALE